MKTKKFIAIFSWFAIGMLTASLPLRADPISPPSDLNVKNTVPSPLATQVLEDLHRTNAMEIEMGKLAQTRASSPEVQAYAQTLVADHEEAQKKVTNLASDRNLSIGQANQTSSGETATTYKNDSIGELNTLKGTDFDRSFLKQMVTDHTKTLKMLRAAESKLTDAQDVKKLTVELIPVLERHLSKANDLLKRVGKKQHAG
jgi:putative membrane protein